MQSEVGCDHVPSGKPVFKFVYMVETLLPMRVTATMQTTIIRANMTAYSVTVGPCSLCRKRAICLTSAFIAYSISNPDRPGSG